MLDHLCQRTANLGELCLDSGVDETGLCSDDAPTLLDGRIANDLTDRFAPWHDSAARLIAEIADHHYEAREVAARAGNESVAERFADAFRIRKSDG